MTNTEFRHEFDILYDSISSMSAPGLDDYEKSVFLTGAQLQIIKEYFGPINKYRDGFENSLKRRADLRELVEAYETAPIKINNGLTKDMSFSAEIPKEVFMIVHEQALYHDEECDKDDILTIIPVKYDEISETLRNPFRRPSGSNGYRIDIASKDDKKIVELVSDKPITSYTIRYIKYPTPIVLTDLSGISSTKPLSIDGVSTIMQCKLDPEIHREILDRAVQMALIAYKPENAVMKIQADQRNN